MKSLSKNIFIVLILFQINSLSSQVSESFDNWSDASYGSISTYGEWISNNALTSTQNARSGKAVRLRNNSSSYLEYVGSDGNGIDGGVGEISFWYRSWDSSPTAVYNVEASVDGQAYSTIGTQISTSSTTYSQWSYTLDSPSDNIKIKISNVTGERLHIDDFIIQNFGSTTSPGLTLGTVSGNTSEDGTTATFTAVLDAQPTSDVLLNISSGDENEVTVSPSTLSFNNSNWDTPQTITLSGVDDLNIDADAEVTITVSVDDDSSDDTYDGITESITVTNENNDFPDVPDLIITEVADPNGTGGDKKRYIEIFNNSDSAIDLSDYKIKKYTGNSSSSAETTMSGTLLVGEFYIIASSASDFLSVYGFSPDKSTSNVISGNGDDSYAVVTASTGYIVDLYGDITQSGSNYADGTGTDWEYEDGRAERLSTSTTASSTWVSSEWNVHNDSNGGDGPQTAPTDYDPGYWIGATSQDTWNGLSSSDFADDDNWASGYYPISTDNIFIREATNIPQASSTTIEINNLIIKSSGSLTISAGGSLTTSGDFTNNGTVTMSSSATAHSSLVVGGTATGDVTYNRYADADRWYITSSPVSGQDIDTFISSEDLAVSTNNTSLVALADYNNDGTQYAADPTITTGWWDYHESGQSDSGDFTEGKAKIVRLASDATDNLLTFTGTLNTSTVTVPVSRNTTKFNMVGNPFTAAIAVNASAATTNALSSNPVLSERTAWFWDGSVGSYSIVNQNPSQTAKFVPPGQGFFIASKTGGGNFNLTSALQSASASAAFNRQTAWSKIDLTMSSDNDQSSATEIVYFEGATTGWDNGFDSTNFSSGPFQLYTDHVDYDVNQNLGIQSLPIDNYDNMVVPVGVNALAGQTITISVETTNWPEGVNVYLEDTNDNSFTLLDVNDSFTTLLDSDENGIGRFYIHTTSNSLGDGDLELTDIVIYAPTRDNLRILGLNSGSANVQMFDIMGKQVLNTSFEGQSVNDVKLPNLNTGVYVVTLVSDEGSVNKKLIIK